MERDNRVALVVALLVAQHRQRRVQPLAVHQHRARGRLRLALVEQQAASVESGRRSGALERRRRRRPRRLHWRDESPMRQLAHQRALAAHYSAVTALVDNIRRPVRQHQHAVHVRLGQRSARLPREALVRSPLQRPHRRLPEAASRLHQRRQWWRHVELWKCHSAGGQ